MLTQKEVRENAGISQHADLVRGLTPACAAWRALTMSDATIFSPAITLALDGLARRAGIDACLGP